MSMQANCEIVKQEAHEEEEVTLEIEEARRSYVPSEPNSGLGLDTFDFPGIMEDDDEPQDFHYNLQEVSYTPMMGNDLFTGYATQSSLQEDQVSPVHLHTETLPSIDLPDEQVQSVTLSDFNCIEASETREKQVNPVSIPSTSQPIKILLNTSIHSTNSIPSTCTLRTRTCTTTESIPPASNGTQLGILLIRDGKTVILPLGVNNNQKLVQKDLDGTTRLLPLSQITDPKPKVNSRTTIGMKNYNNQLIVQKGLDGTTRLIPLSQSYVKPNVNSQPTAAIRNLYNGSRSEIPIKIAPRPVSASKSTQPHIINGLDGQRTYKTVNSKNYAILPKPPAHCQTMPDMIIYEQDYMCRDRSTNEKDGESFNNYSASPFRRTIKTYSKSTPIVRPSVESLRSGGGAAVQGSNYDITRITQAAKDAITHPEGKFRLKIPELTPYVSLDPKYGPTVEELKKVTQTMDDYTQDGNTAAQVELLCRRSKLNCKLGNLDEALHDARTAFHLDVISHQDHLRAETQIHYARVLCRAGYIKQGLELLLTGNPEFRKFKNDYWHREIRRQGQIFLQCVLYQIFNIPRSRSLALCQLPGGIFTGLKKYLDEIVTTTIACDNLNYEDDFGQAKPVINDYVLGPKASRSKKLYSSIHFGPYTFNSRGRPPKIREPEIETIDAHVPDKSLKTYSSANKSSKFIYSTHTISQKPKTTDQENDVIIEGPRLQLSDVSELPSGAPHAKLLAAVMKFRDIPPDKTPPGLLVYRSQSFAQVGMTSLALKFATQALKADPTRPSIRIHYARLLAASTGAIKRSFMILAGSDLKEKDRRRKLFGSKSTTKLLEVAKRVLRMQYLIQVIGLPEDDVRKYSKYPLQLAVTMYLDAQVVPEIAGIKFTVDLIGSGFTTDSRARTKRDTSKKHDRSDRDDRDADHSKRRKKKKKKHKRSRHERDELDERHSMKRPKKVNDVTHVESDIEDTVEIR